MNKNLKIIIKPSENTPKPTLGKYKSIEQAIEFKMQKTRAILDKMNVKIQEKVDV